MWTECNNNTVHSPIGVVCLDASAVQVALAHLVVLLHN